MTQLHLNSLAVAVCHVHHELLEELVDVGLSTVQDSPGQSSNWPMVSLVPSKTDFVSELFYKKNLAVLLIAIKRMQSVCHC